MGGWTHVFVVYRLDYWPSDGDRPARTTITIKEVLATEDEAVREVERLMELNAEKGCEYQFQSAKYYPAGRGEGPR